jgi:hypothetical protein
MNQRIRGREVGGGLKCWGRGGDGEECVGATRGGLRRLVAYLEDQKHQDCYAQDVCKIESQQREKIEHQPIT